MEQVAQVVQALGVAQVEMAEVVATQGKMQHLLMELYHRTAILEVLLQTLELDPEAVGGELAAQGVPLEILLFQLAAPVVLAALVVLDF